jgi:hypothetical protein
MTLTPAETQEARAAGVRHAGGFRPRPAVPARGTVPRADHVLAVTARPGQESADLGGLLYAFRRSGARLAGPDHLRWLVPRYQRT